MVLHGHKILCFLRAFSAENNTGEIYIYIFKRQDVEFII